MDAFLKKIRKKLTIDAKASSAKMKMTVAEGALIRVRVTKPEELSSDGNPDSSKSSLEVMALIDPGASVTVVSPQLARTCGLPVYDRARIAGLGHTGEYAVHAADLLFPGTSLKPFRTVRVIAAPFLATHVSCLLGRDVLQKWKLVLDGKTGEIEIEE